jgi:hypothetical protein
MKDVCIAHVLGDSMTEEKKSELVFKVPFSMKLTSWLSAIAALFASLTALSVYEGELNRQRFLEKTHAYEVSRDVSNYILSRKLTFRTCENELTKLSKEDFTQLMRFDQQAVFQPSPVQQAALSICIDDPSISILAGWPVEKTRAVRFNVIKDLHALDAPLVSFDKEIGDPNVICENLRAYFDASGPFYQKLIDISFIDDTTFQNIKHFKSMLDSNGNRCPPARANSPARATGILKAYESFLGWVSDLPSMVRKLWRF